MKLSIFFLSIFFLGCEDIKLEIHIPADKPCYDRDSGDINIDIDIDAGEVNGIQSRVYRRNHCRDNRRNTPCLPIIYKIEKKKTIFSAARLSELRTIFRSGSARGNQKT